MAGECTATMKQLSRLSKELSYPLRIVILILFFNGLLALVTTFLSLFNPYDFFFDPRIVNIALAFGLARKNKVGYVLGVLSISANVIVHLIRLSGLPSVDGGAKLYFLSALTIDFFQLYILLRGSTRKIYYKPKEQDEL